MVTFVTEGPPCSCGLRPRGIEVAPVRVNKRSLRTTGFVLGAMPWRCDECRADLVYPGRQIRELDPRDAAKVAAYRARRWPDYGSAAGAPASREPEEHSGE